MGFFGIIGLFLPFYLIQSKNKSVKKTWLYTNSSFSNWNIIITTINILYLNKYLIQIKFIFK